ncbi:MAG TPA: sulfurtransferase [Burkholderiales bacterium]|nr:sulfurtransferase [Burkholderiales bacterium]
MKTTLVTVEELKAHPEWRVFDCRHELANPDRGAQLYKEGHVPGALFAHLDRDLSAPKTGENGRHPLPKPAEFVAWLGRQGLKPSDQVIAYDAMDGMFASRLWWMLRWVGHDAVAVLDGGYRAWTEAGGAVTTEIPCFAPTVFPATVREDMNVDVARVQQRLGSPAQLLVDGRAAGRFAGIGETIDPVAGHIPGARNRPYLDNVGADGRFKPPAQLREEFNRVLAGTPAADTVHQCGSGVSAAHNLLAMEVAGLTGGKLYAGSWSEWCSDPARPVATGTG